MVVAEADDGLAQVVKVPVVVVVVVAAKRRHGRPSRETERFVASERDETAAIAASSRGSVG